MTLKKSLKIFLGLVIFITLPSFIFLGFMYYKHHENIPNAIKGVEANKLATKMLVALNYEAYRNTNYIEWTFKNRRHYHWDRAKNNCEVIWKGYKVKLDFSTPSKTRAYVHGFTIEGEVGAELITKAYDYFENDVFWLIAPYQVFDEGVTRAIVTLKDNTKGLLVTYNSNTSYLWKLNHTGMPISFKMWDEKTPIKGLEASWNNWTTVESGAKFPTFHKILFFSMALTDIVATAPKKQVKTNK